ncbi:hypothetical protein GT020_01980 [Glutamicibacter soli]|uniref:Uncharacterized protein n=1 Tax=Glutamicibacter soli TaxID=453836 RepID=A0A6L9G6Q6_9MICC|nr:hypothetical protein [Glutamicibacter soli]NAZ14836.1 hypothetical protein [Glutamicibacter soli]
MPETIFRWRSVAASVVLIIGLMLAPISIAGLWATKYVTHTDGFTQTLAPLGKNPQLQENVSGQISQAISNQLQLEERIDSLTGDGFISKLVPSGQIAEKVDGIVGGAVHNLVQSNQFASLWESTLRASHAKTVAILSGNSASVALDDAGALTFQLSDVLGEVVSSLTNLGIPGLGAVTNLEWDVQIIQSDALPAVQRAYTLIETYGPWLVYVSAGLLIAAVILNPRYVTRALIGLGLVTGVSALAMATLIADYTGEHLFSNLDPAVADLIYHQATGSLTGALTTVAVVAGILGAASWPISTILRRRQGTQREQVSRTLAGQ